MANLVADFIKALLGIFKKLLPGFIDGLEGIIQTGLEIILYTPVPKRCVKGASQSYPNCPTTVALVQKPANPPWPSVFKTAWSEVMPTAVTILFVLYLVIRVLEAVPGISQKKTRQAQTSIFGALVTLPFSWSFGAGVLVFFSGLTKALAPTPDELLPIVTTQLTALLTAAATPGGNFLALGVSGLDGALLIGAVLAYLFRILFLIFVMQYIHLLAVIYLLDVPVLNGITTKIFEIFIALSFLPILVAGMFDFATTVFSSESLPFLPDLGGFAQATISMVLPAASLGLYHLALKGAMLSGMSKTLGKVESAASGTAVGDLGEASSDEYGGLVEEKTAQLENRVQQGSKPLANMTKRAGLHYASGATTWAKNPKKVPRMMKGEHQSAREVAPSSTPHLSKAKQAAQATKNKLSAYKNVPESASKAVSRGETEGREGRDRGNVGSMGKKRPDTDTAAYQFGEWDNWFERKLVQDENTGKSIARTMGSVRESGRSIEEIAEESQMPSGGVDAEERNSIEGVEPGSVDPGTVNSGPIDPESVEQGEEPFDRMIDESDLSIEGAQILMENIQDEYGEDVMKEKMDEMSYVQLARESGREQAEVSLDPSQVEDIISPPDWRM
ncbi:hypothetical protein [Halorussus salinus]|uniref:hypothetical protein n=1 Tax=Halorussus salinus TaxID=1364935 RepID=UPI0010920F98|nr:hypothetical protein [Halorussus salinus]